MKRLPEPSLRVDGVNALFLGFLPEAAAFPVAFVLEHSLAVSPAPGVEVRRAALFQRYDHAFALLGAEFRPSRVVPGVLRVRVGVSARDGEGLDEVLAGTVAGALRSAAGARRVRRLGGGVLDVLWAVRHPVDSTGAAFERVALRLVPLLDASLVWDAASVRSRWAAEAAEDEGSAHGGT